MHSLSGCDALWGEASHDQEEASSSSLSAVVSMHKGEQSYCWLFFKGHPLISAELQITKTVDADQWILDPWIAGTTHNVLSPTKGFLPACSILQTQLES